MFVSNPGTSKAETCIAYSRLGEETEGDEVVEYAGFKAYFEGRSIPFLDEAKVDYSADRMGGQLTIRAPNAKMPKVTDDSSIEDKINYALATQVNPGLASHGGAIELVEVTDDMVAVINFSGGCQGCSSAELTLNEGVKKSLMDSIPELTDVRDMTDHSDNSQAYFK